MIELKLRKLLISPYEYDHFDRFPFFTNKAKLNEPLSHRTGSTEISEENQSIRSLWSANFFKNRLQHEFDQVGRPMSTLSNAIDGFLYIDHIRVEWPIQIFTFIDVPSQYHSEHLSHMEISSRPFSIWLKFGIH